MKQKALIFACTFRNTSLTFTSVLVLSHLIIKSPTGLFWAKDLESVFCQSLMQWKKVLYFLNLFSEFFCICLAFLIRKSLYCKGNILSWSLVAWNAQHRHKRLHFYFPRMTFLLVSHPHAQRITGWNNLGHNIINCQSIHSLFGTLFKYFKTTGVGC